MEQRNLVIPARVLAQGLHAGQRTSHGEPVTEHLERLAQRVQARWGAGHPAVAVAWLSLSLADGGVSEAELRAAFSEPIAQAVLALAPRAGEGKAQHEARVLSQELAAAVWHELPEQDVELLWAC